MVINNHAKIKKKPTVSFFGQLFTLYHAKNEIRNKYNQHRSTRSTASHHHRLYDMTLLSELVSFLQPWMIPLSIPLPPSSPLHPSSSLFVSNKSMEPETEPEPKPKQKPESESTLKHDIERIQETETKKEKEKEKPRRPLRAFPFMPRMYQCDTLFWNFFYILQTLRPTLSTSAPTTRTDLAWMFEPPTFVAEKQLKLKYADRFDTFKAQMKAVGLFPYVHIKDNLADMGTHACLSPKSFFALCLMERVNAVLVGCMPPTRTDTAVSTPTPNSNRFEQTSNQQCPQLQEQEVRLVHQLMCNCDDDAPIFLLFQLPLWNAKQKQWAFYYYVAWEATDDDCAHYSRMTSRAVPLSKCSIEYVCSDTGLKLPRKTKTTETATATTTAEKICTRTRTRTRTRKSATATNEHEHNREQAEMSVYVNDEAD